MHSTSSFREFYHRFGYIPISQVAQEAFARCIVFLLLYVPFLLVVLPASFFAKSFGVYKIVVAVVVFLCFLGLLRNRKIFVAELGQLIGVLKEAPSWIIEFFVVGIVVTLASLLWLPFWLVYGMLFVVAFLTEFLMKADELGRQHTPKQALDSIEASRA
jgi:hypothetical protein